MQLLDAFLFVQRTINSTTRCHRTAVSLFSTAHVFFFSAFSLCGECCCAVFCKCQSRQKSWLVFFVAVSCFLEFTTFVAPGPRCVAQSAMGRETFPLSQGINMANRMKARNEEAPTTMKPIPSTSLRPPIPDMVDNTMDFLPLNVDTSQ